MKVKSAVMRVFRFDLRCFAEVIAQFALIIALFSVMMRFGDTISQLRVMVMFITVIPMNMTLQRYAPYFGQIVGFSVTKKNFIVGGLLIKPIYMCFATLTLIIGGFIDTSEIDIAATIVGGTLVALIGSSLGDLIGALMLRLGKLGYSFYAVTYILVFGIWGALNGMAASSGKPLRWSFDFESLPTVGLLALVMLVACTAVSYLLIRRIEVRT